MLGVLLPALAATGTQQTGRVGAALCHPGHLPSRGLLSSPCVPHSAAEATLRPSTARCPAARWLATVLDPRNPGPQRTRHPDRARATERVGTTGWVRGPNRQRTAMRRRCNPARQHRTATTRRGTWTATTRRRMPGTREMRSDPGRRPRSTRHLIRGEPATRTTARWHVAGNLRHHNGTLPTGPHHLRRGSESRHAG
jgi:hypothetical protein